MLHNPFLKLFKEGGWGMYMYKCIKINLQSNELPSVSGMEALL